MVEAATKIEADASSAAALTESYNRVRSEVEEFVSGTPVAEEFGRTFSELEAPAERLRPNPMVMATLKEAAQSATVQLGQLGGWLDGFIQEQTLHERLRLEAEEKVKADRRQQPGFS
jgi:hypothetical protein